jgi:signal transduction histidine kinase
MSDNLRNKILTIFKSLLAMNDPIEFLQTLSSALIDNFDISFGCFFIRDEENYHMSKQWNTKIKNFPVIEHCDLLIQSMNTEGFYNLSKHDEKPGENSVINDLKSLSFNFAFKMQDTEKEHGIIFLGPKKDNLPYSNDEIDLLKESVRESRLILSDFFQIKKITTEEELAFMAPIMSMISHDVRNPVQMISILTEMLQARELTLEKRLSLQSKINNGLDQITTIVSEISDFFQKRDQLNLERISCTNFLNDIARPLTDSLKKMKITLEVNIECEEEINADIQKLTSVINKLLKFSREQVQYDGIIAITVFKEDDSVTITIQDTSEGIEPEFLQNIFDPFFSFGGKKGVGLSFAIIKSIIEAHKGQFNILSQVGEGTKYLITLPRG